LWRRHRLHHHPGTDQHVADPAAADQEGERDMTGLSASRNGARAAIPYWRILVAALATTILLLPIGAVAWLSLRPRIGSALTGPTFDNFIYVFTTTDVLRWTANSLMVSLFSAVASVLVAAPAGYVLSRAKGRAVSAYSLLIFVI